jgi:hypothetical protein
MRFRYIDTPVAAAAKAGFSTTIAYRIEADPAAAVAKDKSSYTPTS